MVHFSVWLQIEAFKSDYFVVELIIRSAKTSLTSNALMASIHVDESEHQQSFVQIYWNKVKNVYNRVKPEISTLVEKLLDGDEGATSGLSYDEHKQNLTSSQFDELTISNQVLSKDPISDNDITTLITLWQKTNPESPERWTTSLAIWNFIESNMAVNYTKAWHAEWITHVCKAFLQNMGDTYVRLTMLEYLRTVQLIAGVPSELESKVAIVWIYMMYELYTVEVMIERAYALADGRDRRYGIRGPPEAIEVEDLANAYAQNKFNETYPKELFKNQQIYTYKYLELRINSIAQDKKGWADRVACWNAEAEAALVSYNNIEKVVTGAGTSTWSQSLGMNPAAGPAGFSGALSGQLGHSTTKSANRRMRLLNQKAATACLPHVFNRMTVATLAREAKLSSESLSQDNNRFIVYASKSNEAAVYKIVSVTLGIKLLTTIIQIDNIEDVIPNALPCGEGIMEQVYTNKDGQLVSVLRKDHTTNTRHFIRVPRHKARRGIRLWRTYIDGEVARQRNPITKTAHEVHRALRVSGTTIGIMKGHCWKTVVQGTPSNNGANDVQENTELATMEYALVAAGLTGWYPGGISQAAMNIEYRKESNEDESMHLGHIATEARAATAQLRWGDTINVIAQSNSHIWEANATFGTNIFDKTHSLQL